MLHDALTEYAPHPPFGVPYDANVTDIVAPGVAQYMLIVARLMTSAQKGDETGPPPPLIAT